MELLKRMQNYKKIAPSGWSPDLMEDMAAIPGLSWSFTVAEDSLLEVVGHIDCEHRGIAGTSTKAVMVAFKGRIVSSAGSARWISGSTTGCNIVGEEDHYAIVPIAFSEPVSAGSYTVEIWGRSASTAAPGVNGLAEIKDGYTCITYKLTSTN